MNELVRMLEFEKQKVEWRDAEIDKLRKQRKNYRAGEFYRLAGAFIAGLIVMALFLA